MKHFAIGSPINLSRVDQERKLSEILAKEAPTDRDAPKVAIGVIVQIEAEEEK